MDIESLTGSKTLESSLGVAAALTGLIAVFCSVMIYVDTRRPFWNGPLTSAKFFLTMLVLGIPTSLLISLVAAAWPDGSTVEQVMADYGQWLIRSFVIVVSCKLLFEAMIFSSLRHKQHTPLRRTAQLLVGELSMVTIQRFFFGILGGIALPLVLLGEPTLAGESGFHPLFYGIATLLIIALLTTGELMERYLFFRAVIAPKMPGAPAT